MNICLALALKENDCASISLYQCCHKGCDKKKAYSYKYRTILELLNYCSRYILELS